MFSYVGLYVFGFIAGTAYVHHNSVVFLIGVVGAIISAATLVGQVEGRRRR